MESTTIARLQIPLSVQYSSFNVYEHNNLRRILNFLLEIEFKLFFFYVVIIFFRENSRGIN